MALRHTAEDSGTRIATPLLTDDELESFVTEHGVALLAVARRFSRNAEDADDVYQQTLERVLIAAPSSNLAELAAWAKTVARNVALDELRRGGRQGTVSTVVEHEIADEAGEPADQIVADERDRQLTQAVRRLRPDHARCLLLRAAGRSYPEICSITGFSYAKVNRCLSEGRKSLLVGYRRIVEGEDCERLVGALSMYADGIANDRSARDVELHLESCLACQSALREFRAAPRRVAATVPVGVGAGEIADPSLVDRLLVPFRRIGDAINSAATSAHDAVAGRALTFQQYAEAGAAKQAAVVVGVSATLVTAGAGIGVVASEGGRTELRSSHDAVERTLRQEPESDTAKPREDSPVPIDSEEPGRAGEAAVEAVENIEGGGPEAVVDPGNEPASGLSAPSGDEFVAPLDIDQGDNSGTSESAPDLSP